MILGGPTETFEWAGRQQLIILLEEGLNPQSRVLDVGCGSLRAGYWLTHFLDPRCYHGIEPDRSRVQAGLDNILEPEVVEHRQPRFSHNDDFDFSVFGERFDMVLVRSVWVHASKDQIRQMLQSFSSVAAPGAKMLASYLPADPPGPRGRPSHRRGLSLRACDYVDYDGDDWVDEAHPLRGRSLVAHNSRWVFGECRRQGLFAEEPDHPVFGGQHWLRITLGEDGS